jgi:hypothetical protein
MQPRPRSSTTPRMGANVRGRTPYDPLPLCVYTTIGLLAWALGPSAIVMAFGGLGLIGYGRAARQGLRRSRCFLRDVRLVIAYLGAAFALGAAFTALRILHAVN